MATYLAGAEIPPETVYWTAEIRRMVRPAVYVWELAPNVACFDSHGHAESVVMDLNAYEAATARPGDAPAVYRVAVRVAPGGEF